ncbi:hypothetical protein [Codonopsis torradovirus A]|uniref:hypothetical protein n=1 Tax=Codonopsis torradovirus A TaxID=2879515 RepID=UPI001E79477C|nr:hypothetical protein QK861_sRNA2gp1 [Codonopsis torradovirus A]UBS89878.1 hypothetical protein [Codonopsis torradovirus A]
MSFIDSLDISEEEEALQHLTRSSEFKCVAVSKLLAVPAKVSLDFRRVWYKQKKKCSYSFLRVEWTHSVAQPFGVHVIPSGEWGVSNVAFSGVLSRKAAQLNTVAKLLEENKSKFKEGDSGALAEENKNLKQEVANLEEQLQKAKESAAKAKGKLHQLREDIKQLENKSAAAQDEPSTSEERPKQSGTNAGIFRSWASDGNVD